MPVYGNVMHGSGAGLWAFCSFLVISVVMTIMRLAFNFRFMLHNLLYSEAFNFYRAKNPRSACIARSGASRDIEDAGRVT